MEFTRINPLTGEVASSAPAMKAADMAAITAKAARAQPAWAAQGPNARRAVLMKAAEALDARKDAFVAAMMAETGSTAGWAMFNLGLSVGMVREAAAITTQITGEVIPSDKPGCLAMALKEPVGVILGIAPWNAPIILGVRAIAVPLACGNAVILKASEICPRTHALIIEAFAEAGFPDGVVGVVTNAPEDAAEVVGALIDAPEVKRINFTGSTAVGKIIAKRAAEHLKPCLLELGGKAPLIVLDDADLDEAVKAAAFGAFMNQGQICMSTERIIVVDAVADAFAEKFAAKAASMASGDPREGKTPLGAVVDQGQICMSTERIIVVDAVADAFAEKFAAKAASMASGDPREGKTPLGAVVDQKTVAHVNALIDDAASKGAKVIAGGQSDSVLMAATVVDGVTSAMNLYSDESFGPVVAMIRARDEEHAIELANDSAYGLSAAVFTRDTARGLAVARRIHSGICHVNGPTVHDEAQMPFGGVGASGYGRFGGRQGIDSFTETRWITIETQPGHFPI